MPSVTAHPAAAHFHNGAGSFATILNPASWNLTVGADGGTYYYFDNPPNQLATGQEFIVDFRVHDIQVEGFRRGFDIVEQPYVIPEPSSALLQGIGVLLVAACRRRRPGCSLGRSPRAQPTSAAA